MSAGLRVGDRVRVRPSYPPGHVRTPAYVRGRTGRITDLRGRFDDPEELAYGRAGRQRLLCTVRFAQHELWPGYAGPRSDTLSVDLYEHWLEPVGD